MMRFNLVLLLATITSCNLGEDGTGCRSANTFTEMVEAQCYNDYVATVFIFMNKTMFIIACVFESAWSDSNYYTPIRFDHEIRFDLVYMIGCSWLKESLGIAFGTGLKIKIRSFSFNRGGGEFGRSLSKFDLNQLTDVQELTMSEDGLREFAADLFEDFANLRKLNLSSNNIGVLNGEMFSHATNLVILDLSDNNMTSIDEMLFQNLTRLEYLNLRKNRLTSLHANTFRGATSLSTLNLADNRLDTLPKDLFVSLYNLTSIDISGNQFSEINEEIFSRNTKLKSVYFRHNRGNSIDSLLLLSFSRIWPELEKLQLSGVDLRDLPENSFRENVDLGLLDLSENALKTLRKDVFEGLKNLVYLDISANGLSHIHPDTFSPLVGLLMLNLERNKLTTIHLIPASVQILNAANNQILNISEGFINMDNKKLRVLRLSDNLLGISTENIDSLKNCLLDTCEDLAEIYLDNNDIEAMPYEFLNRFPRMRVANFSNNRLNKVQLSDSVIVWRSLTIDLRHNMIKTIEIFRMASLCFWQDDYIDHKSIIDIQDNPISCDCEIYELLELLHMIRDLNSQFCYQINVYDLICNDPPLMKGVSVREIDHKNFMCRRKIDYSECPVDCVCWWRPNDLTRLLNCSYGNLTTAPELTGVSSRWSIELNLTGNHLKEMPSLNGSGYELVTKIFLSHNNISNLSLEVVPPNLKVLQLEHNNLKSLDARTMNAIKLATNLDNLTLFDNPWDCNRVTRDFLEYVSDTYSTRTTVSPRKLCLEQPRDEEDSHQPRPKITFVRF